MTMRVMRVADFRGPFCLCAEKRNDRREPGGGADAAQGEGACGGVETLAEKRMMIG